jgi:CheY-like chemotaxis protein/nitrogen-specific signal transduction histidine kinase
MISSKIDFLSKYNALLQNSVQLNANFPDELCEYVAGEFELEAAAIFKVSGNNLLKVIGRSGSVRKSFITNENYTCTNCRILNENLLHTFSTQNECEIKLTDEILSESCSLLQISESNNLLFKVSKKNDFTPADIENLKTVSSMCEYLLKLWMGERISFGESLSQIIAESAHELRTPVNSILGFASLLLEENLSVAQSEYVNTLKENAINHLALINDLIDIAKTDIKTSRDVGSSLKLKEFIDEVIKIVLEKTGQPPIEFLVNVDKKIPPTLKLDALKLRYILSTIFTTSIRLTGKGKITISASLLDKKTLQLKISDTGSGIPSAQLKEIFKPFAIIGVGNPKIGNLTGLCLNLVKRYVEFIDGKIDVTSAISKGTTFTLTFTIEPVSEIEAQISALPTPAKKNKILVVEDDYATSKLLSNYLNKWGYEPAIVNSAEQTLKIIEKENFLAILMDIVLPDSSGFELLKLLRENPATKNTPVIVCSVEAEQQKAFLMGAVEYFVKPVQYKYLVEVLNSYKLKKDSNILIVDDDVPTLNLIKQAVEQAGFNTIAESDSLKVSQSLESMNLDLAIIDLDMPEVNGFDLIKQIKTKPQFKKLPVIIYTGKETYQEDLKKIDGMFEELLHKSSSNIEELSETINSMINRYDEPSTPDEVSKKTDSVKILLVEDYKHSQIIVTRLLKKNNFDSIVVVENGLEALEEAKKHKYDIILMDMQMPVMNGFEATEKIRMLREYKDTPIIALTAFAMKGDKEKCLEAGATDYIPKPIDSQEFIEKVKFYTQKKVE